MNSNSELKKWKELRLGLRVLFALVSFAGPIFIVAYKYKLFTKFNGYKLTATAIILFIIVGWRFKSTLMKWVNSWEYSILKYLIIGFSKVYLFILIALILFLAKKEFSNMLFVFEWICIFECIAYIVIYPFENKYDFLIKKELRKQETREANSDTNKELLESLQSMING